MNSRELVKTALSGGQVPRAPVGPLAVHYCARVVGVSLRDYTLEPTRLADCILRYHERFRPDAVWLSADTWVTAQAMGAAVEFPEGDQPLGGTGHPLVRSCADLDRIPPPDPSAQGRGPLMLEALSRVRAALGRDVFVVACFDQYPFSLACALMGIERAMLKLQDDRALVEALMARCAEYAIAYGSALAGVGCDLLSGGDSPAGLLGPKLYREIALPFERKVATALRSRCSLPVSLHICGNAMPILADMVQSGADVLEVDHQVNLGEACHEVGPGVALWGNLDPVEVLARGTVGDVRNAATLARQAARSRGHSRFVLSSGCTLALETPPENVAALINS